MSTLTAVSRADIMRVLSNRKYSIRMLKRVLKREKCKHEKDNVALFEVSFASSVNGLVREGLVTISPRDVLEPIDGSTSRPGLR